MAVSLEHTQLVFQTQRVTNSTALAARGWVRRCRLTARKRRLLSAAAPAAEAVLYFHFEFGGTPTKFGGTVLPRAKAGGESTKNILDYCYLGGKATLSGQINFGGIPTLFPKT